MGHSESIDYHFHAAARLLEELFQMRKDAPSILGCLIASVFDVDGVATTQHIELF